MSLAVNGDVTYVPVDYAPVPDEEQEQVRPTVSTATSFVGKADDEWGWEELRDYVLRQINLRQGAVERMDPVRERSVFQSFGKRWGPLAPRIARYIFEVCNGNWRSHPVDVRSFCKGSDRYVAIPIAERLA